MRNLFLLFFFLLCAVAMQAQQTRQSSWQQKADFKIEVKLNDTKHYITAFEEIRYTNASPHTLTELYFHLWPNAYRKHTTAFAKQQLENGQTRFYFADAQDHGMIDSLNFSVDGEQVKWEQLKDTIDVCRIILNKPLPPGGTIKIETPFRVKFPKVYSRLGHEEQFYAATQWYPKPAVYDVNGWNYMPYLDQGEFYSEFGSFEVKITVPENYVVLASGEVQEASERKIMDELADRPREKSVANVPFPPSSEKFKTVTFKIDNVHDFAWFADKRFKLAKSKVKLASGREVTTWAASVNSKPDSGVEYVNRAVSFYSSQVGEYPYSICTAVDGPLKAGGGMEYPTITICDGLGETVVLHEVGHNWFYGILGSNEREHPWMDEGINSFYEKDYYEGKRLVNLFGGTSDPFDLNSFEKSHESELIYLFSARQAEDQPMELPSYKYTSTNYGAIVYSKTPVAFRYLRGYLGKDVFDACMKTYFQEWKFRHPLPGDIRAVFERVSGKNLDWFFTDLFKGTEKLNYKMRGYKEKTPGTVEISIHNAGDLTTPFSVSAVKDGKVVKTQWFEGFAGTQRINWQADGEKPDYFEIDAKREMPELYRKNNYLRTKGLFKRCGPLRLQFLGSLEHPVKKQVFLVPLIGFNEYNRFMYGLTFMNTLLPAKKLEYEIAPLYAPTTGDINGYASVRRSWRSNTSIFHVIEAGYQVARFRSGDFPGESQYYLKQDPSVTFKFKKRNPRSSVERQVKLRYTSIYEEKGTSGMNYEFTYFTNRFVGAAFSLHNKRKLNPYQFDLQLQDGKDYFNNFRKITATYKAKFNIGSPKKHLDIRLFGGLMNFAKEGGSFAGRYYFQLNPTSYFDYLYDEVLLGRGSRQTVFSQQVLMQDGAFKVPALPVSNTWMLAANFKCDIPGILPIKFYCDLGMFDRDSAFAFYAPLMYNAGVMLSIGKGTFEVYFPALTSADIKDSWALNSNNYRERISFTLNLQLINPLKQLRELSF